MKDIKDNSRQDLADKVSGQIRLYGDRSIDMIMTTALKYR